MNKEQNYKSIITRIWQVCSHIRGVMPDIQLQQVAIAFTFLRRIDCLIGCYAEETSEFYFKNSERLSDERMFQELSKISGGHPFYNHSGYTFSGILLSNNSLEVVLNSYLQGFSKNVMEFLEDMNFKKNLATLQRQSRYLVELFQLFSEIDLSSSSINNEEFVKIIASLTSESSHEFNSPLELSQLICECLFAEGISSGNEEKTSIYDPVCGTGSMLALAGEKAKSIGIHQTNISLSGQEISIFPSAVAKALVLLSGNDNSKVFYGNTLTDDLFSTHLFDYIIADLPLGLQWRPIKDRIEKESFEASGRFYIGLPSTTDSQFLFIEHILSKMNPNGCRAAFISTASVLWSGSASSGESRIRRWLFENDLVETIIALPSGTFTKTNIPVYLWILSNKKNASQKGNVRLVDTSSLASKNKRFFLDDKFVKSVVDEYNSNKISIISQIVKNEQFGYYEVDLLEKGKKKERVTISLDTDINEFVEKERQPYAKSDITIDYRSVEKGYSVQFEKFFKPEQIDVASLVGATNDLMPLIDKISSLKPDIVRIIGRSDSKSWTEYPLRAATEVVYGVNRPPILSTKGLPILSVAYLRNPLSDGKLYEVTQKTKCSTVKDVIVIVKGANSGEVFRGVDGILSPSVASVSCIDEKIIAHHYLYYLLKGYEKELMSKAKGFTIKSLDSKSILDIRCNIPPIEEQLKLASYLDDIIGKIDDIINTLGSTDTFFSSYRQTLIENVVRGYIIINDINKREDK